ncbi:MAG TPA: FAD/NAD(P)-binding oxidoreductase [Candidatus Dormibacteraeota bacterium]|nr:FAD/NAD(P)-binding oxidoreductase [Candidatus Dormibacteraeota bacterium]
MQPRITVLGAGFGGLELATILSAELGEGMDLTLVDASDSFVFGFKKLDVLFGHSEPDAVRIPYRDIARPGVRFVQERVTAIDAENRRVTTQAGVREADYLVVALGADYDYEATPGLVEAENEYYSVAGATRLRQSVAAFTRGHAVVGVCGAPFKCPPAPSETTLMLNDDLVARGCRDDCEITLVLPLPSPVPPSPDTSRALLDEFAARGITFLADRRVAAVDAARRVAVLSDGTELSHDLFLGVPRHRAPAVVAGAFDLAPDGFVPVGRDTMATAIPRVYAVGDVVSVGVPKAGVFAEGQGRVAAAALLADIRQTDDRSPYDGRGQCYVEFGAGRVARVDVDFYSGPRPTGTFQPPSVELTAEKRQFGTSRRARWFGT